MTTPKDRLLGLVVGQGWVVKELVRKGEGDTGGNFSTGYVVERGNERAFHIGVSSRTTVSRVAQLFNRYLVPKIHGTTAKQIAMNSGVMPRLMPTDVGHTEGAPAESDEQIHHGVEQRHLLPERRHQAIER